MPKSNSSVIKTNKSKINLNNIVTKKPIEINERLDNLEVKPAPEIKEESSQSPGSSHDQEGAGHRSRP